jgi:thymidylate synthase (FAD)
MRSHRVIVPALDKLLGTPLTVLDDGFVRVVDYMGNDSAIVQAARISYGDGTKRLQTDRGLIRYLMRHAHTTPFEMCEIKFHVRVPMDCWRQWIRHRTANVNEYSTRYSKAIDSAQRIRPDGWRLQSSVNRQGSGERVPTSLGKLLSTRERKLQDAMRREYLRRLATGVAREQARKDLPLSTYTEAYWKIDLHNLFNFLQLRMDDHAQHEIRRYAETIGHRIVAKWVPVAWEAFQDYRHDALRLTRIEVEIVSAVAAGDHARARSIAIRRGLLQTRAHKRSVNRERTELEAKLRALGLSTPW